MSGRGRLRAKKNGHIVDLSATIVTDLCPSGKNTIHDPADYVSRWGGSVYTCPFCSQQHHSQHGQHQTLSARGHGGRKRRSDFTQGRI